MSKDNFSRKLAAAKNPTTNPETLRRLSYQDYGEEYDLLMDAIAGNPNTPDNVRDKLVSDGSHSSVSLSLEDMKDSLKSYKASRHQGEEGPYLDIDAFNQDLPFYRG